MKRALPWLLLPLALGAMLAAAYLPLPVPPYLDFQVVYHANMGLLRGIPLYDHAGQVHMLAELAGVRPEQVFILPFPYPPWYALATFPLIYLPIEVAARLWLELNLLMLILSTFLLTEGWEPGKRLAAFPLALLFLPVLGALYVGQYVFPVLLGMSLFIYALRHENPYLAALAATLLTFKPHIGGLTLLAGLIYLWLQRGVFGRRALWSIFFSSAVLFAVGFLADPLWPLHYIHSLTGFRSVAGVNSCELCISLPIALSNLVGMEGIASAFWFSGILLLAFVALLLWQGRALFFSREPLIVTFVLATLLISPYLLNYDFVLLLLPLLLLAGWAQPKGDWIVLGLVGISPWFGLGLFGRQGNIVLILSALFLAGWLLHRSRKTSLTGPI